MLPVNQYLKKYIYRIIFCVCIFLPIGAQADILTFDSILSQGENNGDKYNGASWTTLKFKILNPVIGTRRYLNRSSISFTIDSDRNINRTRSDIRIGTDWLRNRKFKSANNKWNNIWVGSGSLNGAQISDIRTFDNDEKVVFAWIIANSDELIDYALAVEKNMPKRSRLAWERMSRDQKFERNIRRFLGASARAELKEYDNFSHSKLILKNTIQPKLKLLNYYNGAIDGIGGPKTTKAIKAFEKANGLLIDGKLFGRERKLLVNLANQKSAPKKIYANKSSKQESDIKAQKAEIVALKKRIERISKRISALIRENMDLKSKINSAKKSNSGWDDDLKNTINGQKNIIKSMRARIASLMEERNRLRDNDNGVISTDPIEYRDLVNTTDNQRKIIKTLRSRISTLSKERNKLIEDKSGGSNKYLITSLENELNSLQIRYDVILKQRDKFRKAAAQGGTNLSATEENQRKIISTLRDRIKYISSNKSSDLKKSEARVTQLDSEVAKLKGSIKFLRNKFSALQREKNKLQASIDGSVGSSTVDKNQLSNLQNKYQKLYTENNTTKIDFDKLERKYKQLIIDVTALERENTKLQVSIDSSVRNSTVDENQLNDLQNKYQKLYTENNVIKIDFDKLDRKYKELISNLDINENKLNNFATRLNKALADKAKAHKDNSRLYTENNSIRIDFDKLDKKYKQLASDFEAKGNVDVQRLTKANEELSISLQKQKILAYDAISQKSTLEEDIKITRAEANKLSKQLSDLNNVATLNSSLKSDLSEARYQINSLKEELEISKNGATADLDKANAKIAELEENLKKSKNEYAELENQISTSETSQQKGFVLSSEWDELKQWITPQQIRFCTILSDYDQEKIAAQESGNQLKQNLAIDNRDADIDALLLGRNSQEKGYFRNWIGTVEQVFAIYQENANGDEELAAGVVIKTPCDNVTVGSGRVKSADDERYEGTAFPSDPIYTQLSQVSKGDPILFEGSLLTYQDTGEANRSSKPRFFTNVDSSVNDVEAEKAKKKDKINAPDYFVKIDYLSKL